VTHQATGSGIGSNTDAGDRGASRPGGQPLPELFSQEGHQRCEETETNICAGEEDLRRPRGTGLQGQHWFHSLLGRKSTNQRIGHTSSAVAPIAMGSADGKQGQFLVGKQGQKH
jgi:hypothetical protein